MSILNVEHLSHGFGDRAIFHDVSFRLLKGEHIGLIGANGEGKSTFMNIITNKLMPDEGKVEWSKNVRVGYLDQHTALEKGMTIRDVLKSAFSFLFEMEARMNEICDKMGEADEDQMNEMMEELGTIQDLLMNHDFYIIDSKVEEIGHAFGLDEIGLDKDVEELSGGQRTKVLLGKLLLEKPDILLLDEPTNYLDVQHIEWLKRYLQEYENAFILISHDIPFLNSVINLIYHMEYQRLDRYVGDYDKFMEVYEMRKSQLEAAYKRQQQEIAELQDFVARNKARVATRNMAMSRQKKLDKMEVIELAKEKPKPEFNFLNARAAGKMIFETKDLVIGYDEPLSKPLNFAMERGEKIAIVGANGIGKTTFLKSILGLIPSISGSVEQGDYLYIGYFEQEMAPGNNNTCIEEIWKEYPSYTQYQVRSALAKCGLTTKNIESLVRVLSGGEQAKLRLCKLMNRETNILLLDEPTNHLDVDAKEELKRALKEYKGAVLLICHEPEFYDGLVSKVWDLSQWSLKI
ncbi:MAG: ABC-F family ATP-binding cassette domain-containing protein [Lachnospiraceae bacterium]|nr:ABC-F family ATP-binding cassette domain-containing protein [Lachnospiraceae bacterium]